MIDIIKSGDLERVIITVIIFGAIAYEAASHVQIDERVVDIALVILGYFFGAMVQKRLNNL